MRCFRKIQFIFTLLIFCTLRFSHAVTLNLPPRPAGALGGADFMTLIEYDQLADRESAELSAVTSGDVPDFMQTMIPVTVTTTYSGATHTAVYYVLPDYLAIGNDTDYFLMPMTPVNAQKIADMLKCNLPTTRMVDDIATTAPVKLEPFPETYDGTTSIMTVLDFWEQNTAIQTQLAVYPGSPPLTDLVDGDKKDVVVTVQLATYPADVAIYGWHYPNGTYIQGLNAFSHATNYADYSHGIRLINWMMTLDGVTTTVANLLQDPVNNVIISNEGIVTTYRYNIPPSYLFPLTDSFSSTGRYMSTWVDKFTHPVITTFNPASPNGDGSILVVHDPSGGYESTRVGNKTDTDYYVQCDIYCTYRPELASDGFERCGIFLRDNGNGGFDGTSGGGGYCYALCWDSDTGRFWCMKSVNGVITDLSPTPIYDTTTGWRTFRIEAQGNQITFKVDGATLLSVTDTTYTQGPCGIGYHEYFTTNSNMIGTRADNFTSDVFPPVAVKDWSLYDHK